MGDADMQVLPAHDFEAWVDDALDHLDDGLESILSFMENLDGRVKQITYHIQAWQKFQRCFAALNLLVVPVVLSIGLCYGNPGSNGQEVAIQLLVKFLMYLSCSIGLPWYLFTLWQFYFVDFLEDRRKVARRRRWSSSLHESSRLSRSNSRIPIRAEPSAEQMNELARVFSTSLLEDFRREMDRRAQQQDRSHAVDSGPVRELPSSRNVSFAEGSSASPLFPERLHWKSDSKEIFTSQHAQAEDGNCYGVQVVIVHSNPELPILVRDEMRKEREIAVKVLGDAHQEQPSAIEEPVGTQLASSWFRYRHCSSEAQMPDAEGTDDDHEGLTYSDD